MTLQPTLIAPFQTGLDTDTESWMSPADSFSVADNVHVYNGYIEKRSGYRKFGHLKTHQAAKNINNITNAANGLVTTAVAHGYSTGDLIYISGAAGMTQVNNRYFSITIGLPNTFLLNIDTTTYGVYGGGGSARKLIDSSERVMGIYQYVKPDGSKEIFAFGTDNANKYDATLNTFLKLDVGSIMGGGPSDFVWATNLQSPTTRNRLYFSNGLPLTGGLNGIRYYEEPATGPINTTTALTPSLGGTRSLYGAKLIFCIKERLVLLNTYEFDGVLTTTNYPQRARWCQAQTPSNWNDVTPGGGGYVDAPTGDQIVSARALQDQIIVFFTDSVWTLKPISDPAAPFLWVKLNDFRACDGKMASVGFDRYSMALGIRGITASDGVDTQRIDNRIRDFISDEINVDYFSKVFAERSFQNRRTWILYPEIESDENSSALIFDEESNAFTTYSINMNCLGIGSIGVDLALNDFTAAKDLDLALEDFSFETLVSYFWQGKDEIFLGGDIIGNIYTMETEGSDDDTDISSVLVTAGWNPYQAQGIEAQLNYLDLYVDTHELTTAKIEFFKDDNPTPYAEQNIDFLPNLDYVAIVSNITNANPGIVTASNHGLSTGAVIYLYGIQGMNEINDGPYSITVIDQNTFSLGVDTSTYGTFLFGGSVYRKQFYNTKTWKRAYAGGIGYLHKVRISSSGMEVPFRISAFKPQFKPRGKRLVN